MEELFITTKDSNGDAISTTIKNDEAFLKIKISIKKKYY